MVVGNKVRVQGNPASCYYGKTGVIVEIVSDSELGIIACGEVDAINYCVRFDTPICVHHVLKTEDIFYREDLVLIE